MTTGRGGIPGTKPPEVPTINPVLHGIGRDKQPAALDVPPLLPIGSLGYGASGGGIPIDMRSFMPANGFAGFAQQTPAVQSIYRSRGGGARRRKRKGTTKAGTRKVSRRAGGTRKSSSRKKLKRLVKGSAAARRYMARIRGMRKR